LSLMNGNLLVMTGLTPMTTYYDQFATSNTSSADT